MQFVFVVCQVEGIERVLKLSSRPVTFILHKAFLEDKKRSGTSLPVSFSA